LKALVLGIDHTIQHRDDEGRLRAIVSQLCNERGCDLIAEEWNTGVYKDCPTVARLVADEKSVRWLNIDIPDRVREKLGILHDLNRRKQTPDNDDRLVSEIKNHVYFPRADCMREQRWLRKIIKSKRHSSVLVLCGFIHVKPFAAKLCGASFSTSTASLCDHQWYRAKADNQCAEVEKELRDVRH
jgi:hypothetical protein